MADTNTTPLTAKQYLIDLINTDHMTPLTVNDVTFSAPIMVDYAGRNTKVVVTANPGTHFNGNMNVFYNRLAISDLGYVGLVSDTPITAEQLLAMLSAEKGMAILAEEFETFAMPVLEVGQVGQIALVAKPTAIKWLGETTIEFVFGLPPELSLLHQLIHQTLPAEGYL